MTSHLYMLFVALVAISFSKKGDIYTKENITDVTSKFENVIACGLNASKKVIKDIKKMITKKAETKFAFAKQIDTEESNVYINGTLVKTITSEKSLKDEILSILNELKMLKAKKDKKKENGESKPETEQENKEDEKPKNEAEKAEEIKDKKEKKAKKEAEKKAKKEAEKKAKKEAEEMKAKKEDTEKQEVTQENL